MNRQRGSSSDLAGARIQWLASNAVRITRFDSSLPPDRPWLRHVLLPLDPKGSPSPSGLDIDVREPFACPMLSEAWRASSANDTIPPPPHRRGKTRHTS